MVYRMIYAHDGRKQILNHSSALSMSEIHERAFAAFFPTSTVSEVQNETGLNWPVLMGLGYPTKATCQAESAVTTTHT